MNLLHRPEVERQDPPRQIVLYGVDWPGYEKILEAVEHCHVRVTYDRGALELMSPLPIHEKYKRFFGMLFNVLAEEADVAMRGMASTTFRREDRERGLEADECYYFSSMSRVRNWDELDLSVDPPPDLAIEVEITRTVLDKMSVYAGLGVPELWRFNGEALTMHLLGQGGVYEVAETSRNLPFFPLEELPEQMANWAGLVDDRELLRAMRKWVRDRVVPRMPKAGPATP
jgi:Uma2 family endonuclease